MNLQRTLKALGGIGGVVSDLFISILDDQMGTDG